MKATVIEMRRNFKNKNGFTRIVMRATSYGTIKYKDSLCYPAYQEGKFVEYVQDARDMTRDEANEWYLMCIKKGFEVVKRV